MLDRNDPTYISEQAQITLSRLLPTLEATLPDADERSVFVTRLTAQFPRLFGLLYRLYGDQYDFYYHLLQMIHTAAGHFAARPADLRTLDATRQDDPAWFQNERMVGMALYVDLFAGDFSGLREKIPYLQELGITYLHLMPLFRAPEKNNDGGYAVSSYRDTNPALGSMDELRTLAAELRAAGISLVLDFIFNHTSNEHTWAMAARKGDKRYRRFYRVFPDRRLPDQYEKTLREIFPDQAPGSFTWNDDLNGWVWTTFYDFQWDLNYENPEVLTAMMSEMLFLANVGVEVLRLDAVAFVWKRLGTPSENLPEAHMIIQALNALCRVVAPAMVFKSEAIVHPDDVASYIDQDECPVSYNPTMMAMIWDSLATRRAETLAYAMRHRFDLPAGCAWVNYVRVHDDIGWSFADDDMARFGIDGYNHRQFLNRFYTGQFVGSFAMGVGFGYNPTNQDMRICGTAASLAGLEQALKLDDAGYVEDSIKRLLLIHAIIMAAGGVPLLYMGDDIATLNDYRYRQDPARAGDARWVHRAPYDWQRNMQRDDLSTPQGQVFSGLANMIRIRKAYPAFGATPTRFVEVENPHVLGFVRDERVLCLFNFSEQPQTLSRHAIARYWWNPAQAKVDLLTQSPLTLDASGLSLPPYAHLWLMDTMATMDTEKDA